MAVKKTEKLACSRPVRLPSFSDGIIYQPHHHRRRHRCLTDHHRHHHLFLPSPLQ